MRLIARDMSYLILGKGDLHVIIIAVVKHVNRLLPQVGDATSAHSLDRVQPRQQDYGEKQYG